MILSDVTLGDLRSRLAGPGVTLKTGPFNFRVRSPIDTVAHGMRLLYADHALTAESDFVDFDVHLTEATGVRRWFHRQARFVYDGASPFTPLPITHAFPLLEWSMNWCISTQAHQYLILHAAVIERDGLAAILPAPPGSGKSTLCAGLTCRGWRLLSDELTLISLQDGTIAPLCRPVSLKNESINIIRRYEPSAVFSDVVHETTKGSVAYMKTSRDHLTRVDTVAQPTWVVFPKYVAGAAPTLTPRSRATGMLELGRNAFNYAVLGVRGFDALGDVVERSECYDFEYSALDDAVRIFDGLVESRGL